MKILFIEDEKEFARSLKRLLELNHYLVDLAYDGEAGLELLKKKEYDLLILDIMLPKMDGFEVAKKVHQEKISTPIIMLTARDAVGDRIKGLDSGADDYLVKPFAFEELLARLRSLVRRKRQPPTPTKFQIGDLELSPSNYEVKRGGKLISLNNKEHQILHYLLGRSGKVVTREELGENIWGIKKFKSNTIDVHIRHLRQKIDKGHKDKLIHTIRGRGYKIQEHDQRKK
ncbi:MAG: response regulator transcription factor [Parcubacteria group bacterium]|nr:response regulator transcription factor [Parcubacteria group bacterium]